MEGHTPIKQDSSVSHYSRPVPSGAFFFFLRFLNIFITFLTNGGIMAALCR